MGGRVVRTHATQERVLAHGMAEEELAFVWGAVPETHAAWERLNAEHSDATATDPLAEGWREDPPQQAVERAADGGGNGNGGGGSAGSAATASAPAADASGRAEARLPPGTPQAGPARAAGQVRRPCSYTAQTGQVGSATMPLAQTTTSRRPQALCPCTLSPRTLLSSACQRWLHQMQSSTHWLVAQAAPAASSGHGVSVLRWSTSTKKHHCALLVRDTHTGWELERPYHEGMEQQLPERFKVKFLARMLPSEDPVASVPPGRSFLYLHNPGHGVDTAPTLTLLGVVEEAQLVERSADPMIKRHVYHLGVRRVRDDGSSNVRHQGAQWDRGSALRNVLVYHFGLSIAQADAVPVLLDAQTARSVLHLHDGTPHVPG